MEGGVRNIRHTFVEKLKVAAVKCVYALTTSQFIALQNLATEKATATKSIGRMVVNIIT